METRVVPQSMFTFNPVLVTSRTPPDNRERVFEIVLIPFESPGARTQRHQNRLSELSQRINDLVDPVYNTMPPIFSLTAETFPHVSANFMQRYKLLSRRLREEIFYDVSEALDRSRLSLSCNEHAALQRNPLQSIAKIRKIRDVIDSSLWNFCYKNRNRILQFESYAEQLEYMHKRMSDDGKTIEEAQSDIKRLLLRDRIHCITIPTVTSLVLGIIGFIGYYIYVSPKYDT